MTDRAETFEGWMLVELLGHRKYAAYVREQSIAGASFLRLDVPSEPPLTLFPSAGSVYCLTPIDEALARTLARRYRPEPVSRYEMAALMPARTVEAAGYSVAGRDDEFGREREDGDDEDDDYRPF